MSCFAALCLSAFVIVDGDTFRHASPGADLRYRLWGIQAPEADTPEGPAATRALNDLILDKTLACELRDVDHYGRPVVMCDLPDGRDVACEMIRLGAAEEWTRYSGGLYRGCRP